MSEVKYRLCDHCGKRLDEMKDFVEYEIDEYGRLKADLCANCYDDLNDVIKQFITKGGAVK